MTESLGVTVLNPKQIAEIDSKSFAELVLYLLVHRKNLGAVVEALRVIDPDGLNEVLSLMRGNLFAMGSAMDGVLGELLRIAGEQGLCFKLTGADLVAPNLKN